MRSGPVLAHTRQELREALCPSRDSGSARHDPGARIGMVPTMGALHAGHAALIRSAREHADRVVVSIFVNPLQFGPDEDLEVYPRTLEADLQVCHDEDVDVVFAPDLEEVYPGGDPQVSIDPGPLATVLEGRSRPTHFHGVLTVVAKLFGLVRPDVAVFGQKDYQQLTLVRRMVTDLCLDIEIVGVETVRESDGLALSSRNSYLDPEQRPAAAALSRALRAAANAAAAGPDAVLSAAREVLRCSPGLDVDYLELTDPDLGVAPEAGPARLLLAARVGTTRLIDNTALLIGSGQQPMDDAPGTRPGSTDTATVPGGAA